MHCITNTEGKVLTGIRGADLDWSQNPLDAVASGHAWFCSSVAKIRLIRLREVVPDCLLGLALVQLQSTPDGSWSVFSLNTWGLGYFDQGESYE
jgi:hypothetical protein